MSKYKDVAKSYIHQCKTQYGNSWEVSEEHLFFDIPNSKNLDFDKWAIELSEVFRANGLDILKSTNTGILKISKEKVEMNESKEFNSDKVCEFKVTYKYL